jgi:transcription elongation factor Elf1
MIVNAAIFTCSICGEASVNICSYCTKDACSNHRCERCKRCSDCCECEVPLSAEEPVAVDAAPEPALEPGLESPELESAELEPPEPHVESTMASFLTSEESSVFAEERAAREPRIFGESSVFAEEDEPMDSSETSGPGDPTEPRY